MKSISLAFAVVVGAVALPAHAQPNSETNSDVAAVQDLIGLYCGNIPETVFSEVLDDCPIPRLAGRIGGDGRLLKTFVRRAETYNHNATERR